MGSINDDWIDDIDDSSSDGDPEDDEFISRENDYYDYDAAAGMPIWVDEDTLEFIFSIRYNSPAFDGSLLQENYRVMVHKSFSDLIKTIIEQKIRMMSRRPDLYKNTDTRGYNLNTINTDNIIDIARNMGIDPGGIDVLTLVAAVVESLSKIVMRTIKERPGMNTADKKLAIEFMKDQLWDEDAQLRWRAVSARTLASMYSYDHLPRSVKVISALNNYLTEELSGGLLQSSDLTLTFMEEYLSDSVVQYILDQLEANDSSHDGIPDEMIIDNAIQDIRTGDWQNDDDGGW